MQFKKWICGALAGLALFAGTAAVSAAERVSQEEPPKLEVVAQSDYQWTGIAVSPSNRIFVCFPTWGKNPGYHVGELFDGAPYPFSKVEDQTSFVCVQSLYADESNTLWILDAGRRKGEPFDPAGARLFMVNLSTDEIVRTYTLPGEVLLPDTMLNDVRVDNGRGAAYLTDSGHGGIIVLDLASGSAWRALTDIPEVRANLQAIYFPTGLFTDLAHSDGLELSTDKKTLFFSALGGDILYSIPTGTLLDETLTVQQRQKLIRDENVQNVPTSGMVLREDALYMGALSSEGVWEFILDEANVADAGSVLNLGTDIRWAERFALAPDNSVYFTTSSVNYPPEQQPPYMIYRMVWKKKNGPEAYPRDGN